MWGEGGIERIHGEAGGWPHLVQLIAETAIDLLNDSRAKALDEAMMDQAIARSVERGFNVLHQLVQGECRLPGEWDYVQRFAVTDTQPPPDDGTLRRSLKRRELITEDAGLWRLRVPLMARWLKENA